MRAVLIVVAVLFMALVYMTKSADMQERPRTDWKYAAEGYTLQFPFDHASHPEYRIEWWYYTGNLFSTDGRRFGYQVTFFRVGIDSDPINSSRWAVRDLYMAHLAVTDVQNGNHFFAERLNRAGVGWAGSSTDTLHVWNEGWQVRLDGTTHVLSAVSEQEGFGVDIRLEAEKQPVKHGLDGFSRKGSQSGNASYYYSLTRLGSSGQLILNHEKIEVSGLSWMDHEFGTSFLEPSQQGWDWFSLQLDDGADIMVYRLRQKDGSLDQYSGGTVVDANGSAYQFSASDYRLVPGRLWLSPKSGANYPVEWNLSIPLEALQLDVRAVTNSQELQTNRSTGVTYWEGAVDVTGLRAGKRVYGRGYLEMTGYAGFPISKLLW